jgi:hypothetical protein
MKVCSLALSLASVLSASCSVAAASSRLLFDRTTPVNYAGASGIYPRTASIWSIDSTFAVYDPADLDHPLASTNTGTIFFSGFRVTSASTPISDPGFAAVAGFLTDGQNQTLSVRSLGRQSEHALFHGGLGATPDLYGYVIDRITFTITDWYAVTPGRDPNRSGFWTDFYIDARITIEGYPVPEPASVVLAVSCLGFAARWRGQFPKTSMGVRKGG